MTDNQIIAVFMGEPLKFIHDTGTGIIDRSINYDGYYHKWENLMPVVEKIEKIKGIHTVISELGCDMYYFGKRVSNSREDTKIKTVYKAVVEFVKWYNSQK